MSRLDKVDALNKQVGRRKNLLTELSSLEKKLENISDNLDVVPAEPVMKGSSPGIKNEIIIETVKNQLIDLILSVAEYIGDEGREMANIFILRNKSLEDLIDGYIALKSKIIIESIVEHDNYNQAMSIMIDLTQLNENDT